MTAIAIDLGNKRCGIATQVNTIAFAQEIVARHQLIGVLKKYFKTGNYSTVVVGLPHDLYGKKDQQLDKTRDFIAKLEDIFPDKQIIGVDERFTSFSADQTLQEMGKSENIGQKDALAAAEILQSYLNMKK